MIKKILLAAVVAFTPFAAHAQSAKVLATCGDISTVGSLSPGGLTWLYVDTNGNICGGGGGSSFVGAFVQSSVAVGTSSGILLAPSLATRFIKVCVHSAAANGIWVNWAGATATLAPPAEYIPPGQCDAWTAAIPSTNITAIATAGLNATVIYK